MDVGFIGIGKMGRPMVENLARAGHRLWIHDRDQRTAEALAGTAGVTIASSAQDAVREVDAVITMLPDGAAVRAVVEAIAPDLPGAAVLIDMSTADPFETLALRDVLPDPAAILDAPVSGGVRRAVSGTLTIMAGGAEADLAKVSDMLSAMGDVTPTGPLGSGHAMKVLNNYLSAAGLSAACEAVLIGRAFGLDPDLMADVFNCSTGRNNATEVKLRQHVNNEAFTSGFTMGLMAKDLGLAKGLADTVGCRAEGLSAVAALYRDGAEALGEGADHTEILRILARD